jgi:hypothetical protein
MDDTYVYISVKLYLNSGQTEDSIQEIIQDVEYGFTHDEVLSHEIIDILDYQIPDEDMLSEDNFFDTGCSSLNEDNLLSIVKIDPFGLPDDYE